MAVAMQESNDGSSEDRKASMAVAMQESNDGSREGRKELI